MPLSGDMPFYAGQFWDFMWSEGNMTFVVAHMLVGKNQNGSYTMMRLHDGCTSYMHDSVRERGHWVRTGYLWRLEL